MIFLILKLLVWKYQWNITILVLITSSGKFCTGLSHALRQEIISGYTAVSEKADPEIKPHSIEVNVIPEVLPFDDENGDILSLLQICGLRMTDWQRIRADVEVTTLPLWHGEEEEIVLNFSPRFRRR